MCSPPAGSAHLPGGTLGCRILQQLIEAQFLFQALRPDPGPRTQTLSTQVLTKFVAVHLCYPWVQSLPLALGMKLRKELNISPQQQKLWHDELKHAHMSGLLYQRCAGVHLCRVAMHKRCISNVLHVCH
jgi:hypothetical protein